MEEETTAGAPGDGAATPEASYKGRANPADPAARPRGGKPGEVLHVDSLCPGHAPFLEPTSGFWWAPL
ncbi:unnamed protein product [Lampetra planeri]